MVLDCAQLLQALVYSMLAAAGEREHLAAVPAAQVVVVGILLAQEAAAVAAQVDLEHLLVPLAETQVHLVL